jgi:phosphate butyryltransferase
MAITKLEQMFDVLKSKSKKRLVAAYANDSHTIEAVSEAVDKGIIDGILVGDEETMRKVCAQLGVDAGKFKLVHEPNEAKAAVVAVKLINDGEGELLMKGLVSTDEKRPDLPESLRRFLSESSILGTSFSSLFILRSRQTV